MSSNVREQGERVRSFILQSISAGNSDVVAATTKEFSITRQAVNKHLQKLVEIGTVKVEGATRSRRYSLCDMVYKDFAYYLRDKLEEDIVWSRDIRPALDPLPDNVMNIWSYAFTEMFNNAIDHSEGKEILVRVIKNAVVAKIIISDNGVGIFRKIKDKLGLIDERLAIFELSKGKLTTDPANHSGQGIFFTSRMMDEFQILSCGLFFSHVRNGEQDWLIEPPESENAQPGTSVFMALQNHTARTTKKVFDQFSSGDDYAFNTTVVPLSLAKFGADELVSRSQAKRVMSRVNLFSKVMLDFEGVEQIGQAFADQIFRVYANENKGITLIPINMNGQVEDMIRRAIAG